MKRTPLRACTEIAGGITAQAAAQAPGVGLRQTHSVANINPRWKSRKSAHCRCAGVHRIFLHLRTPVFAVPLWLFFVFLFLSSSSLPRPARTAAPPRHPTGPGNPNALPNNDANPLFRLAAGHLRLDPLYAEVADLPDLRHVWTIEAGAVVAELDADFVAFVNAERQRLGRLAKNAGMTAESINTTATVTLDKVEGGFAITTVHLEVKARIPGADEAAFMTAANNAKAGCPISKLLKAEITMNATLEN